MIYWLQPTANYVTVFSAGEAKHVMGAIFIYWLTENENKHSVSVDSGSAFIH